MSSYDFLDQSAWSICEFIRKIYTDWAEAFLNDREWLNRFRSDDLKQHASAETELITGTVFLKQGFTVEKHPNLGTLKRPDFRINKETDFIIECTLAGDSFEALSEKNLKAVVEEIVDDIHFYPYYINIFFNKISPQTISKKKLLRFLEDVRMKSEGVANKELFGLKHSYSENGWELEFSMLRKPDGTLRKRSLGFISNPAKTISTVKPLMNALNDKKPSQYGIIETPYIICVNTGDQFSSEDAFSEVLFGQYGAADIFLDPIYPEGFFLNKYNYNTGVSVVLFMRNCGGYMFDKAECSLWHNPFAKHPLQTETLPFDEFHFTKVGDTLRKTVIRKGKKLTDLLGIDTPHYEELKNEKSQRTKD